MSFSSGVLTDETALELDGGGGGRITTSSDEDDETGSGGSRRFPVPAGRWPLSGTGVTTTSTVEVRVLVGSDSVFLTSESDEEDEESGWPRKSDSTNDVKSSCLDSICSDELLEDKVEEEEVGAAGAVVFVTICRLTCRGK